MLKETINTLLLTNASERKNETVPSSNLKNYYISYNLFQLSQGLIGIFLNLFFFVNGGYLAVLEFQAASYILIGLSFALSGYVLQEYYPKQVYAIAEIALVVLLVSMLFLVGYLSNVILFGILFGAVSGFFWAGNNILMYVIPRRSERMKFVTLNNILGGLIALAAPTVGGVLVQFSSFPGNLKFAFDFAAASLFLLISAFYILRTSTMPEKNPRFSIIRTLIQKGKSYFHFRLYFFTSQFFFTAFSIIMPIYVFEATGSFVIAGIFASYTTLLAIATNFVLRGGFKAGSRLIEAAIAGIMLSSLLLLPGVMPSPANVFAYGGIFTVLSTPLENSALVEFMRHLDKKNMQNIVALWVNREYYLMAGRAVVIGSLFLALDTILKNPLNILVVFPVLALYSLSYYKIIKRKSIIPALFLAAHSWKGNILAALYKLT